MPPNANTPSSAAPIERENDEMEMRRALGLGTGFSDHARTPHFSRGSDNHVGDRPKRRFVTDGEIPVVVVHGRRDNGSRITAPAAASPVNRLDAAQAALTAEREAREAAERSLAEAQATIRELQTKLGHAALAREELRSTLQRAETELAAEKSAHHATETSLKTACAERDAAEQKLREPSPAPRVVRHDNTKLPRKSRQAVMFDEAEPVQWWIEPAKKAG